MKRSNIFSGHQVRSSVQNDEVSTHAHGRRGQRQLRFGTRVFFDPTVNNACGSDNNCIPRTEKENDGVTLRGPS